MLFSTTQQFSPDRPLDCSEERSSVGVLIGVACVITMLVLAAASRRFNFDDVRAIQELPQVKHVSPQVSGGGQLVYGNKNWSTQLTGVMPDYTQMKSQDPVSGRFFTATENQKRQRIALVGQTVPAPFSAIKIGWGKRLKSTAQIFRSSVSGPPNRPRSLSLSSRCVTNRKLLDPPARR